MIFAVSAPVQRLADFIAENRQYLERDAIETSLYTLQVGPVWLKVKVGRAAISFLWGDEEDKIPNNPPERSEGVLRLRERPNEYLTIYKALKGA